MQLDTQSKHLWGVLNLNDEGLIWRLVFTWKLSTSLHSMLEEKNKKEETEKWSLEGGDPCRSMIREGFIFDISFNSEKFLSFPLRSCPGIPWHIAFADVHVQLFTQTYSKSDHNHEVVKQDCQVIFIWITTALQLNWKYKEEDSVGLQCNHADVYGTMESD